MKRAYGKVVIEPYDATQSPDQAVATGAYARKFLLDDDTVARVEYFLPRAGLCKVSYRQIEPPFDHTLAEHFGEYPADVFCEIIAPQGISPDGLRIETVYLFKSPADLELTRVFLGDRGWVVRRTFLGPDGQPTSEEHPRYNDAGEVVGRKVYDAITGQLILDADYSQDD